MGERGTQACGPDPDHVTTGIDAFEEDRSDGRRYVEYTGDWDDATYSEFTV